jgi:predicted ATPase/class 3 adenylate cyclase
MKCPACERGNPSEALFCMKCGAKLERKCSHCGAEFPEEARFCMNCGKSLVAEATPTIEPQEGVTSEAERRQLTVMFCDLVGSTQLSEQLDPEDLREVVRAYQETCGKVISRFEGHIAQHLGDGLLVYFGYPQAHEDDAQRAVRSGLGIVEAITRLNPNFQERWGVELALRVGIHTGLVVTGEVGDGTTRERLAMGKTPNIAARLQEEADLNSVFVSTATYRLIEGFFACRHLDALVVKGLSQPLDAYQVRQESAARSRLDAVAPEDLTTLVGREQEIGLLFERWEQVKEGLGQVVLLGGEAGIGKSRLTQVLKEHVAKDPQAWLTPCQCSAYHRNSALYPLIDVLERVVLQFQRGDEQTEKLSRLEGFLVQYGFSLPEMVPIFANLFSVPLDEKYTPSSLSPERQKQKIFQTLVGMLLEIASRQPLLLVMEDLHWADPSTLEFLDLLVDQIPTTRILALFTFRPEFSPPWSGRAHLTTITLHRLIQKQVKDMARHVTGGKALPDEVLEQIVSKTDGVPLFVEELTKMVRESGLLREEEESYELIEPLPPLAIPATLKDSLMARLDRLASVKEVAQMGATLGRELTYEMLKAVSSLDEETLQKGLRQLVEAELLYQRGIHPQATYIFKHALIQETAYQSMLRSTRQKFHGKIARVLEERFLETAELQPELLGHHFTEAGLTEQAIPYWQRAGEIAIRRSAHVEAISHFTKGLELLKALLKTPERAQQELALQSALGPALIATKGYGAPEVEHAYARALELCREMGEPPQIFQVMGGLWNWYLLRAEHQAARELGNQLLTLAQRGQKPAFLMAAHRALGTTLFWLGEFSLAREHLEQGIGLYDPQQHRSQAFLYGATPGVTCRVYAAWTLCSLGYPDQALQRSHEAITLAQELSHPFSLTWALIFAALIHHFRREAQAAQQQAEAAITLSTEQGFAQWLALGTFVRGWALAVQGQVVDGIAQMSQGLAGWRATGAELTRPWFLVTLAEAYRHGGQADVGLRAVAEALALVEKRRERASEAELYRVKGELLLRQAGPAAQQAETWFRQAIDVARRQRAKSLELQAAMSLGRLWQTQGKKEEARRLLSEIFGWFTEGFDTADLKDAKAMLEELS